MGLLNSMAMFYFYAGLSCLTLLPAWAEPQKISTIPRLSAENRSLTERFVNPPPSARIRKMVHGLPDQPEAQDALLKKLAVQGFGGFVCNVSFSGYLEDETKWPAFLRGVHMAKAAGMALWLYDECGYPSGAAHGLTLRGHPEWGARGLLIAETNTTGGPVVLVLPPGKLVLAAAVPRCNGHLLLNEACNLELFVAVERLHWQAPQGDWFVVVMTDSLIYAGTHAETKLFPPKMPYINLLMREPTLRFLQETHQRYAEKLGKNLGAYFTATFTDEPSLMSVWMRPMPYRVLPWSETFAATFQKQTGRDLIPLLPALVADAGPLGEKTRYNFWRIVAALVSENFFGELQHWCHQHKMASSGHLMAEEHLTDHVGFYGDFFRCARRLDAPGIDCLTSLPPDVPWHIAKMVGSVADLCGRSLTMCEISDFRQHNRSKHDERPIQIVTEKEIRGTCNRLLWGGINTFNSYYWFRGINDDQLRRLNTYIGRCSTMLRGGHQVTDIAVLYPIESLWTKFVPAYCGATHAKKATRLDRLFEKVSSQLYHTNYDFSYIDVQALCEASVRRGRLKHGDLCWRVLILPDVDTLPIDAWETIERFWRKGGTIVSIGDYPLNSADEFPSERVQTIARKLFGAREQQIGWETNKVGGVGVFLPFGTAALLPQIIDSVLARDAFCTDPTAPVHITHRRIDHHDIYFAINDSSLMRKDRIYFRGPREIEQWDPMTGGITALSNKIAEVTFAPYGAMLFRTKKVAFTHRIVGSDFRNDLLNYRPLSIKSPPSVNQGRCVRACLTGDSSIGWHLSATLTKGNADSSAFIQFKADAAQRSYMQNSLGLMIEVSVPVEQCTPSEFLMILCTENGDLYLAKTNRYLSETGTIGLHALFSEFKPFKTNSLPLDLSQIVAVRVGWGGYFGIKGEQISFTTQMPQCFGSRSKQKHTASF